MKTMNVKGLMLVLIFLTSTGTFSQEQEPIYASIAKTNAYQKKKTMKTFVIEREIPDAGKLSREQLEGISQKSNEVIAEMGPGIEWVHSYVTDNKVYCVYKATDKELLKTHAEKGGFPANNIEELSTTISPSTAKN